MSAAETPNAPAKKPSWSERREKRRAERKVKRLRKGTRRREVSFVPPEGVPINFEVASLGARFGAQFTDILITLFGIIAFLFILGYSGILSLAVLVTIGALLFFLMRVPYYLFSELFWNGRTLGKRFVGIRVVSADGRALTPHAITVRNLMKEMEIFAPGTALLAVQGLDSFTQLSLLVWIIILLAVPLTNRRRQRLGDILANTVVVNTPKHVLLPELASKAETQFTFLPHHLDHYGRFELQTLERLLAGRPPAPTRRPRPGPPAENRLRGCGHDRRADRLR